MTDGHYKYNVSDTHICMMLVCHNHNIQKHFTTPTIYAAVGYIHEYICMYILSQSASLVLTKLRVRYKMRNANADMPLYGSYFAVRYLAVLHITGTFLSTS